MFNALGFRRQLGWGAYCVVPKAMRTRATLVVMSLAFAALATLPPLHAEDPPAESTVTEKDDSLKTALAALKAWRKSFVNLRLHWSITHKGSVPSIGGHVEHTELVCTDAHQVLLHNYTKVDGQVTKRVLRIWTPDRHYSAGYPDGPSKYEEPVALAIGPNSRPSPDTQPIFSPPYGPLYGLRDWSNWWLPELVDKFPTRFSATTAADGIHLACKYDTGLSTTFLLDPAHACLPSKREVPNFDFTVEEFRKIGPEEVWIPWKGSMKAGDDFQTWQVQRAEVNQKIDNRIFKPPVVDGTVVTDDFEKIRYTQGKDYRGEPGTKKFERSAPASAGPDIHWSSYLVAGAVVAILVAIGMVWLSRRS